MSESRRPQAATTEWDMVSRLLSRVRMPTLWYADLSLAMPIGQATLPVEVAGSHQTEAMTMALDLPLDPSLVQALEDRSWTGSSLEVDLADRDPARALDPSLKELGAPRSFGLLRLDCHGEDYALLAGMMAHDPGMVLCGFNASIPFDIDFVQNQGAGIGCSLKSLVALTGLKGYMLIDAIPGRACFMRKGLADMAGLDNKPLQRIRDDHDLERLALDLNGNPIRLATGRLVG
ncbi:MAG: hypothetical protein ACPGOY_02850 [Rhodospirillaceae bacterium]